MEDAQIVFPNKEQYYSMQDPLMEIFSFSTGVKNVKWSKKLCSYYDETDQEFYAGGIYYSYQGIKVVYTKNNQTAYAAIPFSKYTILEIKEDNEEKGLLFKNGKPFIFFSNLNDKLCFLSFVDLYNKYIEDILNTCFETGEEKYNQLIKNPSIQDTLQNIIDILKPNIFENMRIYYFFICSLLLFDVITSAYIGLTSERKEETLSVLRTDNKALDFISSERKLYEAAENAFFSKYPIPENIRCFVFYLLVRYAAEQRFSLYYQQIYENKYNGSKKLNDFAKWCYEQHRILPTNEKEMALMSWFCLKRRKGLSKDVYEEYEQLNAFFMELEKIEKENQLYNNIFGPRKPNSIPGIQDYSIEQLDLMTGKQFEDFISELFGRLGYKTKVTKTSGDQGIDVIVEKNNMIIGIQTKCYSSKVGNAAIQEAVAGKAFYHLDRVMVITNNYFTKSASELAEANGVILWDRSILDEKMNSLL